MAEWAQVPEDVLTQWASESVPEALCTIRERSLQADDFQHVPGYRGANSA